MEIEINPTHLSINELNYELRIRRVVSCRGQDEKRKILRRLLVRQKTVKDLELHDPEFSFTTEQDEINATLESITQLVIEFEGNKDDSTFKRAKSRLSHISERISRLPIIVGEDDEKERLSFKNEAFATCISLEADLYDKITDQSPAVNNASSTSNSCIHSVSGTSQSLPNPPYYKSIPVYKWGETFSGDKSTLSSFLENVEELRKARHVSKTELFESARDLFVGDARCWFRQTIDNVKDWDALVEALKRDFRSPYHDDELWETIKCRIQMKSESVVIYFAKMNELFGQLTRIPAESTKLRYIRNNLIPEYRKAIAMTEVSSVSELYKLIKRLEDDDYLDINIQMPSSSRAETAKGNFFKTINAPSYPNASKNYTRSPKLLTIDKKDNNIPVNPDECWNCHKKGHFYSECRARKSKFCYRCGLSNVTVRTCTHCQKN